MSVTPSSVNFTNTGDTNTFSISEINYTSAFTITLDAASCSVNGNSVATVSPMTAPGPSATFTITAGAAAGTCKITVSDIYGQQQTVNAGVTITQGVLQ